MNPSTGGALLAAASILSSCAPSQSAAFAPVERLALERIGQRVSWQPGERHRAEIARLLGEPLSLDAAVKVALVGNQDLQAHFEAVGLGIAEIAAATLDDPELDAELKFPTSGSGSILELGATQDLLSLLTLPARRKAAKGELEAARYEAVGAVIALVAEVSRAYYRVQAAAQIEELRRTVRDAAAAQLELTERIHAAGNTTDLALAQHRAQLGEARIELSRAEIASISARERLNELCGLSGTLTRWTVEARLDEPPAEPVELGDLERLAIERSVELAGERARIGAAASRIGAARLASWLPRLGVGVAADRESGGEWSAGPAVTLALPLWNRNRAARARGHSDLRRAQRRYTAIAVKARARARAVRSALAEARARAVFVKRELLPTTERVLAETLKQYNAMNATPFEVLAAKREQIAAATAYIEALEDYWRSRASIDALRAGSTGSMMMGDAR